MNHTAYTTTITSARSDRAIAFIALECPVNNIDLHQHLSFTIIKGFRNLATKYKDSSQLALSTRDGRSYFIHMTALPTEATGVGTLSIDAIMQPVNQKAHSAQEVDQNFEHRQAPSFLARLRRTFSFG